MAEPLKNRFGPAVPRSIARQIAAVHTKFPEAAFLDDALSGYDELDLTPRAWHIARALRRHLPESYPAAMDILLASMGPRLEATENLGMAPFHYLPHVFFVAEFGLDDFEVSMRAQYELTQRFTAEFSIRAYLERHRDRTLERLRLWATDPNPHVRRLVSEGTRPRLPWAARLREFQKDPRPVLALLELLKDDPELYVRRSVANNLNDIGKDHPDVLAEVAERWLQHATEERQWIVKHALRSAVKRGEAGALHVLGFGRRPRADIEQVSIAPPSAKIGGQVVIAFDVVSRSATRQRVLVDFRIHYVKADGHTSPKVFKLTTADLPAGGRVSVRKSISLREMTTRKHHPGEHRVDALLNGSPVAIGAFRLTR